MYLKLTINFEEYEDKTELLVDLITKAVLLVETGVNQHDLNSALLGALKCDRLLSIEALTCTFNGLKIAVEKDYNDRNIYVSIGDEF